MFRSKWGNFEIPNNDCLGCCGDPHLAFAWAAALKEGLALMSPGDLVRTGILRSIVSLAAARLKPGTGGSVFEEINRFLPVTLFGSLNLVAGEKGASRPSTPADIEVSDEDPEFPFSLPHRKSGLGWEFRCCNILILLLSMCLGLALSSTILILH